MTQRFNPDDDGLLALHFPAGQRIATPGIIRVADGPWGRSQLATRADLEALAAAERERPEQFVRLLGESYGIAHGEDNHASIVVFDRGLPIPLGDSSPNGLMLGRSGAGKTYKGTLPAAAATIQAGDALVYFVVKGKRQSRILRRIAAAASRSHEVSLLAPRKPDRSAGFAALSGCSDLSRATEVASCMVSAAARTSRSGEGTWAYNQAEEWIAHAIAAICSDLPSEQQTLVELRQVVIDGTFQAFAKAHPNFPALQKFSRYYEGGNRNGETIAATIGEATAFIDDAAACLGTPEFVAANFAKHGGILIVEIDEHDIDKMRSFCALVAALLISALQREACASPSGALRHKTVIVIDELAALGMVAPLPASLHTCREQGFCFFAGTQSVSQVAAIYGPFVDVVLAGFQSQIALGGGLDMPTAEYLSRKSGTVSIAVPSVIEQESDEGGGVMVGRSWGLGSRPLLLPDDIANPLPHPLLGSPATVFLGDGTTRPFQAYLTAAYEVGSLAKLMDEVAAMTVDNDLRPTPLTPRAPVTLPIATSSPAGEITNTDGWATEAILRELDRVHGQIGFADANGSALAWWKQFIEQNRETRPGLCLRLAEELRNRNAKIADFFLAFVYSNTDHPAAALAYMDYTRLKKQHEREQATTPKTKRAGSARRNGTRRPTEEDESC